MPYNPFSIQYKLTDIKNVVVDFWQHAKQFRIMAFNGEMGAGKTTFIHALCGYLRVEDAVSSPTFALINEYHFNDQNGFDKIIYHMDWYRIDSTEEAMQAGMEDALMNNHAYCFVEWPEKALSLLPKPYLNISIKTIAADERRLDYSVFE